MPINLQDLEEYAAGRGAGAFSPQQGSMVPMVIPTRQGGLPLGMAPSSAAAPTTSSSPGHFLSALPAMPTPTGTPPGMPAGMPPGLPLAPASGGLVQGPGQPGLVQLGGSSPSVPMLLQQALAQMNTPRPWGRGEGIGNILQSIGAGLQGQRPTWMGQEEQELERRQKALQLGLAMHQVNQQGEMQQAQMGHMSAQNRLLAQQAQEYGWKTMERVSRFYPFVPDEQKQQFLDEWRPVIKEQLGTGLAGDRPASALANNDRFIDHMIGAGEEKGKAFVSSWPFLSPQQRVLVAQQAQDDPKKATELANVFSQQAVLPHLSGLERRVSAVRAANPHVAGQPLELGGVLGASRATPVERAAIDWWLANEKPEVVTATLSRYGIESPFTVGDAAKAQAIEIAKQATVGGQAEIAGKRATTAKTLAEIPYVGVRTVPGQGGMIVNVPPSSLVGGGAAPGSGINVGPVPQTPTTQPTTGGVSLPLGGQVIARTPLPGMTPEAARAITTQERITGRLDALRKLTATGDLDNYIGPAMTGARWNEWAPKNLPTWLAGETPNALALLDQAESDLKNLQIRDITGAAVRESEEPRILATVPNRMTDKPGPYRAKLMYQIDVQRVIERRTKDLLGSDGKLRTDVDREDVLRRYPMPEYGQKTGNRQTIDLRTDDKDGGVTVRGPVLK